MTIDYKSISKLPDFAGEINDKDLLLVSHFNNETEQYSSTKFKLNTIKDSIDNTELSINSLCSELNQTQLSLDSLHSKLNYLSGIFLDTDLEFKGNYTLGLKKITNDDTWIAPKGKSLLWVLSTLFTATE